MRFRARRCLLTFCLLPALFAPLVVLPYSGSGQNVPAQRTGGFGEQTCTSCHSGTLNPAGGGVTIGRPVFYVPALVFQIAVTIQDGAANRRGWGFQLSARFANGTQAGSFTPRVGLYDVQTVPSTGVQYVSHRPAPVQPGNSYIFTVDWVAPPDRTGGDVIFNAAAMASDGSGSGGDHVFTAQATANAVVTPSINAGGIVNAASYEGAAKTAAPGSLISIFGMNLAPVAAGASDLPLPIELASTRALISGLSVPLLYVSPTQVNAQVPFAARPGQSLAATVQTGGVLASASAPLQVEEFAPAFFTLNGMGSDAIAARHADYRLLDDAAPAVPGETVLLYCTGLGLLEPPLPQDGQAATGAQRTLTLPTVTMGGVSAIVDYAGAAPGFVGLYQINAVVPSLPASKHEVVLSIGGKKSQTGVTIRIQP